MAGNKKSQKTEQLDVFMNSVLVGKLERKETGGLSFTYAPSWLAQEKPIAISRQLPLQEKPLIGEPVHHYFDNLLPDDKRVREKIAARYGASTHAFDLLATLGRDCIGALQIYPEGTIPNPIQAPHGVPLSNEQIAEMIRNLRINPLGINGESDFRISLAGAQAKTALLWKDNQWHLPEGTTPTTHILKPAIGALPDGPDFSLSVENEWLCLEILRAYGMNVAESEILNFEGIRTLSIKRFDRAWIGSKLVRIPQEDLCQALGVGTESKYEAEGGPGIGKILSFLNESDRRDKDRRAFMKSQVLFWLLAAVDGHAKNFSVFIRPGGFVLTPFYDVLSADPHLHPSTMPKKKLKLAMAVGDNRHYKIDEITWRHWNQTATKYKFTDMEAVLHEVVQATPAVIEQVRALLPPGFPKAVNEAIFHGMNERIKTLQSPT